MGSFHPANTLLLLAATVPSSWSFHLSSMFVGMMFSGVVLAKWSLSSEDMTLRAFSFNKLSISLNLDASNFFLSVSDSSSYTTPLLSFGLGATQKACVSPSNTAIPSIASKVVESCPFTASALPWTTTRFQLEALSDSCWRIRRRCRRGCIRRIEYELRLVPGRHLHEIVWLIDCFPPHPVESLLDRAPGAV